MNGDGFEFENGYVQPLKITFFQGISILKMTNGGKFSLILTGKFPHDLYRT